MRNKYFILVLTFLCLLVGQSSYSQDWGDLEDMFEQWESEGVDIVYYDDVTEYVDALNNDDDPYNDLEMYTYIEEDRIGTTVVDWHTGIAGDYVSTTAFREVENGPDISEGLLDVHVYTSSDTSTPDEDQYPPDDDTSTPDTPTNNPNINENGYCDLVICSTSKEIVDYEQCKCVPRPKPWYFDNDGDGWHDVNKAPIEASSAPGSKWKDQTKGADCDDNNANVTVQCDRLILWYFDNDGDGYHSDVQDSTGSPGLNWQTVTKGEDCDDDNPLKINNCNDDDIPCKTSKEDLKLLFPNLTDERATLLANTINKFSKDYGIDTQEKLQHFLAQTGHESNNFKTFGEYTNHQPKNIMSGPFSDYFNNFGQEGKDPQKADISSIHTTGDKYVNGEKFLNIIYDDRNPNRINKIGNIYNGDGYKFRGRGALQITGRDNYANFTTFYNSISNSMPKDFTKTPDDLKNNFEISIHASLWFFQKYVLNGIKNFQTKATNVDTKAQDKLITRVSNIVNGGGNGLADRKTRLKDAKTKIKCN